MCSLTCCDVIIIHQSDRSVVPRSGEFLYSCRLVLWGLGESTAENFPFLLSPHDLPKHLSGFRLPPKGTSRESGTATNAPVLACSSKVTLLTVLNYYNGDQVGRTQTLRSRVAFCKNRKLPKFRVSLDTLPLT